MVPDDILENERNNIVSWLSKFCRHIDMGDKPYSDAEALEFFKNKMKTQFGWDTMNPETTAVWTGLYYAPKCSHCGKQAIIKWTDSGGWPVYSRHCPRCGFFMRNGVDEE